MSNIKVQCPSCKNKIPSFFWSFIEKNYIAICPCCDGDMPMRDWVSTSYVSPSEMLAIPENNRESWDDLLTRRGILGEVVPLEDQKVIISKCEYCNSRFINDKKMHLLCDSCRISKEAIKGMRRIYDYRGQEKRRKLKQRLKNIN